MREQARMRQAETCVALHREVDARVRAGYPADVALADIFRAARHYGARDRRLFAAAVFAEFRWRGWVRGIEAPRLKLAAALALDGLCDHARALAEHPAIEAGPPAKLREKAAWFERQFPAAAPARIEALVPDWILDELLDDGAPGFAERFIEAVQQRPPLWLRARHGVLETVCAHLRAAGFTCAADPRVPDAVRVEGSPSADVLRPILHRHVEIQDIASQCVVRFCAPRPGERWWDMCAGSGGKSLHLLEALRGTGHVYCTDVRANALRELKRRTGAAGYLNWSALGIDVSDQSPGDFDGILIDAPCSGVGTWSRNPDARWRIARADLDRYRGRQQDLLARAFSHLKPGGRVIYAVCSLTKTETRDAVAAAIKNFPARAHADLRIDPFFGPGIGMWAIDLRLQ